MSKNLFNPNILSIKLFSAGPVKVTPQQLAELLAPVGTIVEVTATPMVFDGNALVPAAAEAAPVAVTAPPVQAAAPKKEANRKVKAEAAPSKKAKAKAEPSDAKQTKAITFTPGSDPEKIWQLIRTSTAMTSTQIREKLGLGSNIVNTTVYRLKNAGMIRPMSHNAPNGDTLYTSTEWDGPAAKTESLDVDAALAEFADGLEDEAADTDVL